MDECEETDTIVVIESTTSITMEEFEDTDNQLISFDDIKIEEEVITEMDEIPWEQRYLLEPRDTELRLEMQIILDRTEPCPVCGFKKENRVVTRQQKKLMDTHAGCPVIWQ